MFVVLDDHLDFLRRSGSLRGRQSPKVQHPVLTVCDGEQKGVFETDETLMFCMDIVNRL